MSDTSMSGATSQGSSQGSSTSGLKQAAGQTFQEVKSRTKDAVPRITESVRHQAMEQAETAKDALASTAERLARSLRESNANDDSVQARLMLTAADAVTNLSDQIRDRSFDQLWGEVQGFARRNPGAFVAAAAVAGFALARFARASSRGGQGDGYGSYDAMGGSPYGSGSGSMGGSSSYGSGVGGASMGGSSGVGTGSMGTGGGYAGAGSSGTGYGSGMGGAASTSGTGATGDEPGSIADDGLGGGTASGQSGSGQSGSGSTSGTSGSDYDR